MMILRCLVLATMSRWARGHVSMVFVLSRFVYLKLFGKIVHILSYIVDVCDIPELVQYRVW